MARKITPFRTFSLIGTTILGLIMVIVLLYAVTFVFTNGLLFTGSDNVMTEEITP